MRTRAKEKLRGLFGHYTKWKKRVLDEALPGSKRISAYVGLEFNLTATDEYLSSRTAKHDIPETCRSKLLNLMIKRWEEYN